MNIIIDDTKTDRPILELFELLGQTASTLEKRRILTENMENETFGQYLRFLLDPFLITGISGKKIAKQTDKPPTKDFGCFSELMEYLFKNNTGTDEIISNIQSFLKNFEQDMREFYCSIITKSAKIGCDTKTVNKAFGYEFIPQWEVQQSYNIEKSPLKDGEWFSLSQKLNGVRGTYFEGKIISRQGKEFSGLEHITEDINKLFPDASDWVLDGELVRKNIDGLSDNENFRIGTGLLSADDADKSDIILVVFDLLPKNEFLGGESSLGYKNRLSELSKLKNKVSEVSANSIFIVDVLYSGEDASQIDRFLDIMVSEDKEGLMLNRDSQYKRKRHNGILKVKRFYTVDLKITDTVPGEGRLSGKLGAFVVDYKGNFVNVGSGMTDEQREEFWHNREKLVGRVIEVKYKEESKDKKTGLLSLQFPVFVSLREEGKAVSYF